MDTQITKETPAKAAKEQRYLRPRYEVDTSQDEYFVRVYLPGVKKEAVDITLDNDDLLILGHRSSVVQDGWKTIYRELPDADYRLKLQLNVHIDGSRIGAKVEDGILTVTLPVAEEAKPRQISVN